MSDLTLHPCTAGVDHSDIDDLRARLGRTRWPDQPPGTSWELGTDISFLRELCDHWADGFAFTSSPT